MNNIHVKICGTSAVANYDGKLTSGMVGLPVSIEYDETWNGLYKTASFRVGKFVRSRENIGTATTVPWEVMRNSGKPLEVGIEGKDEDGNIVIPTIWASISMVYDGATASIPAAPNPDIEDAPSGGGVVIDDSQISSSTTWSSQKISDEIESAGGGGGSVKGAVLYTEQTLTEEQQKQARENIGAAEKGNYIVGNLGNNLFDKTAITPGHYIAPANGNLVENSSYCVTDFIPVVPGETYTVSKVEHSTYFNRDKIYKSGGDQSSTTFTIPDGVYYFRCSVLNTDINTFQMNVGDTLLPYDDGKPQLTMDNFGNELLHELKDTFDEMDEATTETKIDTEYFERLRRHLANPFIKTQIKLLGDSITHGMGGTGFSATGEQIPGANGKQNVLTATCWSNMLYHYINDNFNKDVEVSPMDEGIKYNAPSNNQFVFGENLIRLEGVSQYVLYCKYARQNGNVAIPNAVEFSFYGDHFSAIYMEQKYSGIFEIYVDDEKVKEIDAYSSVTVARIKADVTGLTLGEHTVRIATTGRKNESALSYQFNLCGLVIPKTAIVKPWGVSGSSSKYPLDLTTLYDETDDFVIMQFGTNDRHMFYTPDSTCENLIDATNNIKSATGADVILMASCPAAYQFEYGDDAVRYYHMWDVRNAVAKASHYFGMPYIDNYDAFMRYADQHDMPFTDLLADGLHPNDLGYKVMYENIMRTLGLPIVPNYETT